MRAELRALDTADAEGGDLRAFRPEDGEHFTLAVTAFHWPGERPRRRAISIHCLLSELVGRGATPEALCVSAAQLPLDRWDPELVERAIGDLCRRTEGENWHDIAVKLARYGHWEFEDYRS